MVIAAGIAVAVVVAVLFLGGTFSALWDRSSKPVPGALTPPANPPSDTPVVPEPATEEDCADGGYRNYGALFSPQTEEACRQWVRNNT